MYKLRALLHSHPWALAPVFLGFGVLYAFTLRGLGQPSPIFLGALAWAACAFVCGRVLRVSGEWPRLSRLGRSDYSATWDALSPTAESAARAVSGFSSEEDLRASGEDVALRIAHSASLQPSEDVLEIACGIGRIGWAMAPRCRTWTGCDISANMISHARRRLAEFQNIRLVHLLRCNLEQIEEASVDLVYCTNALIHMDQKERFQYVRDAHRILRNQGRLYIDTIALDSEQGWHMIENNLAQVKCGLETPPYIPNPSTPDELVAYFAKAGFTETRFDISDSLLAIVGVKK